MAAHETLKHNDSKKVKLGFVEDIDYRLLSSKFFPSKVGGKPAWLCLDALPEPDCLQCGSCGGPTIFFLQVYAPLKTDDTFHRSIFLFVCTNKSCTNDNSNLNFKVYRSQLPLVNSFYSREPPNEDLDDEEDCSSFPCAECYMNLCHVCGVKSSKRCGQCKKVYYCSKEHQTLDWKSDHKKLCNKEESTCERVNAEKGNSGKVHKLLFKEYELVTEEEELEEGRSSKNKTDEERLEEYKMMMHLPKMKGLTEKYKEEELDKAATEETEDDKHFLYFKERIDVDPSQVLRYSRGEEPLWVSAFHKPLPEEIPNCSCGAARIFEFQVMPQLLNYLKVDSLDRSLDWGTLCVYTCSESCSIGKAYHEEFLWKQDFYNSKDSSE